MTEPTPSGPASLPSRIVLECDRARKSAYVRAASPRKLAAWCFEHLDRAAQYSGPWRNPETDPPQLTGVILVRVRGGGPALVNVEERWMSFWDGFDETDPTDPSEWDGWCEIAPPPT